MFDFETIVMLEGSRLVDIMSNYAPYVKSVRKQFNRPRIWEDLDELVDMIRVRKQTAAAAYKTGAEPVPSFAPSGTGR